MIRIIRRRLSPRGTGRVVPFERPPSKIGVVFLDAQAHKGNGITIVRNMLKKLRFFD
jgi:hypothetical protein